MVPSELLDQYDEAQRCLADQAVMCMRLRPYPGMTRQEREGLRREELRGAAFRVWLANGRLRGAPKSPERLREQAYAHVRDLRFYAKRGDDPLITAREAVKLATVAGAIVDALPR